MKFYYKDILDGNNVEMYAQMFNLSTDDLIKYARVCKIILINSEIVNLVQLLKEEVENLEKSEIDEYQGMVDKLQGEAKEIISDITPIEEAEETNTNINNRNLLVYSSYIDESMQRTINAHSGKEEQTLKSLANLIDQLRQLSYLSLRTNGLIHQNQKMGSNKPCYVDGIAYERLGSITTKVCYLRIPINDKNRDELNKTFNINFETLYLINFYGDFKNEGYDETRFYSEIYIDLKKHLKEIACIFEIFRKDFTPETRKIAIDLISNGFKLTDELTAVKKNQQTNS